MQNPLVRSVYCMPVCGSHIKDIESKYYVALRCSVHRNLGTIIAANPSTILAVVRLGDREKETLIRDLHDGTIAAKWQIPHEVRRALRFRASIRHKASTRRLEQILARTGRLLPKDYWADIQFLSNWMGETMKAYLRGLPSSSATNPCGTWPDRLGRTHDHPGRGRNSRWNSRYPPPLFRVRSGGPRGPRRQKQSRRPVSSRARIITSFSQPPGGLYRYNIHDLVHCVGFHGYAPVIEFLNKGSHFSSLSGEKLSEHQVIAAVEEAQQKVGLQLRSYLCCLPGVNLRSTRCSWRQPIWLSANPPGIWPGPLMNSFAARTSSMPTGAIPSDSAQSAPSACPKAHGWNSRSDGSARRRNRRTV